MARRKLHAALGIRLLLRPNTVSNNRSALLRQNYRKIHHDGSVWRQCPAWQPPVVEQVLVRGGPPVNRYDPRGTDWWDPTTNTLYDDPPESVHLAYQAWVTYTPASDPSEDWRRGYLWDMYIDAMQTAPAPPVLPTAYIPVGLVPIVLGYA